MANASENSQPSKKIENKEQQMPEVKSKEKHQTKSESSSNQNSVASCS